MLAGRADLHLSLYLYVVGRVSRSQGGLSDGQASRLSLLRLSLSSLASFFLSPGVYGHALSPD